MKKILIIGNAQHGKDTLAELIHTQFGLTHKSSSEAALEIFLYDELKDKYNYATPGECFMDRVNHRKEWHDLMKEYNQEDPTKLARGILRSSNIYVGMRSDREARACLQENLFDLVVGVFDPRKPLEPNDSFNIDLWDVCDVVIPNAGSIQELNRKVIHLKPIFEKILEHETKS